MFIFRNLALRAVLSYYKFYVCDEKTAATTACAAFVSVVQAAVVFNTKEQAGKEKRESLAHKKLYGYYVRARTIAAVGRRGSSRARVRISPLMMISTFYRDE